jgi:hypothetical protein
MATNDIYSLDYLQTHMLGLIVSIMNNYGLSSNDVHNYIVQTQPQEQTPVRSRSGSNHSTASAPMINIELAHAPNTQLDTPLETSDSDSDSEKKPLLSNDSYGWLNSQTKYNWASESSDSDTLVPPVQSASSHKKIYVAHRRAFRDALSRGTKICPRYKNCKDDNCQRFHVLEENLCPHAGDNNHCNDVKCDKIVIKTCRRGRGCPNKESCSFRH